MIFRNALMEVEMTQASYQYYCNLMEEDPRSVVRLVVPDLLSTFPNLRKIVIACSCHANGTQGKRSFDTQVSWAPFH